MIATPSWNDAMEFCKTLNDRERAAGRLPEEYEFNLPTEAQWEYACRAGTTDATYAGPLIAQGRSAPVLDKIARYNANSPDGYTGKGLMFPVAPAVRTPSRKNNPIPGGFMTWRGISGSGATIGTGLTLAAA